MGRCFSTNEVEPFFPEFHKCTVINVHDGDTVWVKARYNGRFYKFNLRMMGYDSPEFSTSEGKKARDAFAERVLNKTVGVIIHKKKEKYGRLLATLRDRNGEINKWMVEQGYGKLYSGGKKT